ncbi:MAG: hypothetical protein HFJ52_07790 [Clostridia bacterium]|nr:hypothetical protein [Clostridia bacterium]
MKVKTKSIIALMIALFAVMLIGVTTVNAVEVTDEEQEFCNFTIQSSKGNIDNMGQGDGTYQELGCMVTDIPDEYYLQLNTGINLGTNINLKGLGDFTLNRTYSDDNGEKYYEYKSAVKSVKEIDKKVEEFEFDLKDIDTNKIQHFTLKLSFIGEIEKTYTVNDKTTGVGISLNATTELGLSLKADTIKEDNETYIKMKNTLAISNNNLQIFAYDISLVGGNYKGDLQITFNLGTKYDNKQVTVLHKKQNNEIETFEQKVVNGKVTIKVNELSPFMIALEDTLDNNTEQNNNGSNKPQETTPTVNKPTVNKGEKDETPKTGIQDITYIITAVVIISAVGIIATIKRKQSKH